MSLAAAPCPDPMYLCGGRLTVSASLYQAARSGLCSDNSLAANASAAASGVCHTLLNHPQIVEMATADACQPTCLALLEPGAPAPAPGSSAGSGSDSGATISLAPPPPPPPAPSGCWSYLLQIDAPTEAAARTIAAALHNATTAGALLDDLASYAAPAPGTLRFDVGPSGALGTAGYC